MVFPSEGTETHILYHGPCPDGLAAAWCAHRVFGAKACYHMIPPEGPLPEIPSGSLVYFLDVSRKLEVIRDLAARMEWVQIIDHHQTNLEEILAARDTIPNLSVVYDKENSAAILTYTYFFPQHHTPPALFRYIEDRDIWRWALPESKTINAAIGSYPMTFDTISRLLDRPLTDLRNEGAAIERMQTQHIKALTQVVRAGKMVVDGEHLVFPVANAPHFYASEIGNQLVLQYPEAPFSATYRDSGTGERYWSFRSLDERMSVRDVVERYGGGGHRNASGLTEARPEMFVRFLSTDYASYLKEQRVRGLL